MPVTSPDQPLDVLIVGAGLSGIAAAHYLRTRCPGKSFAMLEARAALGGTWDLFRYPGVRSDSDMYTLGFSFRPWTGDKAIADGADILQYLKDTATDEGLDGKIKFNHKVVRADWSSADALWTVEAEDTVTGATKRVFARFVFMCSGYYDYDEGYTPDFKGREDFGGQLIHPQAWPEDLDYAGKRVVVIGSGATAVTLLPNLAEEAASVTMLQRSPTYLMSLPAEDSVAHALRRVDERLAYGVTRAKNVAVSMAFYNFCRRFPQAAKRMLLASAERQVGDVLDVKTHFNPTYNPWEQRLCVVPSSDLYRAIRDGRADVVTAHIERFTEDGILLQNGEHLPADIVITATGLTLKFFGGMEVCVDGEVLRPAESFAYKGLMLSGVPNMAMVVGYTNASWTLKAELACQYVCRLLQHMDDEGYDTVRPVNDDPEVRARPLMDLSAGYFRRGLDAMPKQGDRAPWLVHQNYLLDMIELRWKRLDSGGLRFGNAASPR